MCEEGGGGGGASREEQIERDGRVDRQRKRDREWEVGPGREEGIIEKESRERAGIEGSERGERQQTEKG